MARKYHPLPTNRRRRESELGEDRQHAQLRKELQEDLVRTRELEEKRVPAREELRQLLS